MDQQIENKIKKKKKFNELVFKITQYRLNNRNPPDELLKEARKLSCEIKIPEVELIKIFR